MNALQPYPVQWIDRWQLADGAWVTVRPVLPQDHLLERLFVASGMSAQSRYQRFHTSLRELPETVAHYLTDVDHEHHFALVVEHFGPGGHAQVADARFVRDPGHPRSSEFALAVADSWQSLGLGRRLLATLLQAARHQGLESLYGDVLRDNQAMLGLAHALGFRRSPHPDDARLLRLQHVLHGADEAFAEPTGLRTPHPAGVPAAGPHRHQSPAAGW